MRQTSKLAAQARWLSELSCLTSGWGLELRGPLPELTLVYLTPRAERKEKHSVHTMREKKQDGESRLFVTHYRTVKLSVCDEEEWEMKLWRQGSVVSSKYGLLSLYHASIHPCTESDRHVGLVCSHGCRRQAFRETLYYVVSAFTFTDWPWCYCIINRNPALILNNRMDL